MQKFLIFLLLFMLLPFFAVGKFVISHWQFVKSIHIQGQMLNTALVSVQIDEEVLSHSKGDLSDLRIIDEGGTEVPYVLRRLQEFKRTNTGKPRILNLSSVPGKDTTFVVDIGDRAAMPIHDSLTLFIDPATKNFRRQISVEGSESLTNPQWRVLKQQDSIYDYTLEFHVADTTITYPESTYRYLRITIVDGDQRPLPITGIQTEQTFEQHEKIITYPTSISLASLDRATEIIADIGRQGIPTDGGTITVNETNFERPIRIFSSNEKKTWQYVGSDTIYNYNTPTFWGTKTTFRYGETNHRYIKLIIEDGDSPSLSVDAVMLQGVARNVAFLAQPKHSYSLYYGNMLAQSPDYDFAAIYRYFETTNPIFASLDTGKENPSFKMPLSERAPWLLGIGLGVVVLVLGIVIFNLIRRTRQSLIPS